MAGDNQRIVIEVPQKRGGRFLPGVSGNPGGRKRNTHQVEELARTYTPQAIEALVAALKTPKERVPAAIALLDRGWGRPKQSIETTGNDHLTLHLLAAEQVSGQMLEGKAIDVVPDVQTSVASDDQPLE